MSVIFEKALYLIPQKMPCKKYGEIPKYLYRLAGKHEAGS